MSNFSLPEGYSVVTLTPPVTTNGGVTCDYISLKNVHMVYIVATFTQAVGHATGIDPTQATAVAGTGVKAITNVVPCWQIVDISSTDVFTRLTDAITVNCAAAAANQKIIMQINPSSFDVANGFDVLGLTVDNSAQATNFVNVDVILQNRYAPSPTALTD